MHRLICTETFIIMQIIIKKNRENLISVNVNLEIALFKFTPKLRDLDN